MLPNFPGFSRFCFGLQYKYSQAIPHMVRNAINPKHAKTAFLNTSLSGSNKFDDFSSAALFSGS